MIDYFAPPEEEAPKEFTLDMVRAPFGAWTRANAEYSLRSSPVGIINNLARIGVEEQKVDRAMGVSTLDRSSESIGEMYGRQSRKASPTGSKTVPWYQRQPREDRSGDYPDFFDETSRDDPEILSATEAEDLVKKSGLDIKIPKNREMTKTHLGLLIDRKQRELELKATLAARNPTIGENVLGFGVGLLAQAADPINVASAFLPIGGATRILGATTGARFAARTAQGARAGVVGALAVEPLVYFGSQALQDDYTVYDSLANLAFGTILGGGLHAAGGLVADVLDPSYINPSSIIRNSPVEVREGIARTQAARASLGQEPVIREEELWPVARSEPLYIKRLEDLREEYGRRLEANQGDIRSAREAVETSDARRAAAVERLDALRSDRVRAAAELEKSRNELARIEERIAGEKRTVDRRGAAEKELGGNINPARRKELEEEIELINKNYSERATASLEQELVASKRIVARQKKGVDAIDRKIARAEKSAEKTSKDAAAVSKEKKLSGKSALDETIYRKEAIREVRETAKIYRADFEGEEFSELADMLLKGGAVPVLNSIKARSLRQNWPDVMDRLRKNTVEAQSRPFSESAAKYASEVDAEVSNARGESIDDADIKVLREAIDTASETFSTSERANMEQMLKDIDAQENDIKGFAQAFKTLASCMRRATL